MIRSTEYFIKNSFDRLTHLEDMYPYQYHIFWVNVYYVQQSDIKRENQEVERLQIPSLYYKLRVVYWRQDIKEDHAFEFYFSTPRIKELN